ncbi:MAG: 4-(cytidine 5'-diphospho)-2-C-methyl-D-erythritol kinase [bacterium]
MPKAYAKINLTLEVLEKLSCGYHKIESVFQKVSLCDIIKIESAKNGIKIVCNDKDIPLDEKNICWQIAEILQKKFKPSINGKTGVKISINKKIPIGGGLGGGSSDAAAALLELNKFWKLNLSQRQMINISAKVGKDIPFFLTPKSTSLARGLGEKIKDLSRSPALHLVLINPEFKVSTKWAYNNLTLEAKKYQKAANKMIKAINENNFDKISQNLYNDFEPSVIKHFPKIGKIKKDLLKNGAAASLMSGSGSSVYGIFKNKKEAAGAYNILKKKYKKCYLAKTV